jgi:hypothetical protein
MGMIYRIPQGHVYTYVSVVLQNEFNNMIQSITGKDSLKLYKPKHLNRIFRTSILEFDGNTISFPGMWQIKCDSNINLLFHLESSRTGLNRYTLGLSWM